MVNHTKLNQKMRQLPAVGVLLEGAVGRTWVKAYGHDLVVKAIQRVLELWREKFVTYAEDIQFRDEQDINRDIDQDINQDMHRKIIQDIEIMLRQMSEPRFKRVINGTGIILHTNLGRALLSEDAQKALLQAASTYSNLEYDLEKGARGSRHALVEELLISLTGAESALVVNNNAAAVLLVMNTLAAGREAIVSRGELVEIGGSFRIPEVLKLGGVKLVEVGTTNRTHKEDYQRALGENTALILKVHTSNYRIMGFTKAIGRVELLPLAQEAALPLVEDLGSGALIDLSPYGMMDEPPVAQIIKEGVDVVTFSGDKLLGGPQAGIIVGRKKYLEAMKANHLARALRVDKFTLAALEATLRAYLRPQEVLRTIPTYRMLTLSSEQLETKARQLAQALEVYHQAIEVTIIPTQGHMGGGSIPGLGIASWGVQIACLKGSVAGMERSFLSSAVPIVGYIEQEHLILDMRTLLPGDEAVILQAMEDYVRGGGDA